MCFLRITVFGCTPKFATNPRNVFPSVTSATLAPIRHKLLWYSRGMGSTSIKPRISVTICIQACGPCSITVCWATYVFLTPFHWLLYPLVPPVTGWCVKESVLRFPNGLHGGSVIKFNQRLSWADFFNFFVSQCLFHQHICDTFMWWWWWVDWKQWLFEDEESDVKMVIMVTKKYKDDVEMANTTVKWRRYKIT